MFCPLWQLFNSWGSTNLPHGFECLLSPPPPPPETFPEAKLRTEGERGFHCWIGWSHCLFFTARQAPVFHLKRLWIYAANCSHFSSVNHLGAGRSSSPRPQADGWPTGEIEWKPAKPDAPWVLSRYQRERERERKREREREREKERERKRER